MARKYYLQLRNKNKKATHSDGINPVAGKMKQEALPKADIESIDINTIAHDEVREVGAEWLCVQAIEELKIASLLQQSGWNKETIATALVHIVSRAVYPASEHKTAQWVESNSAIKELLFKQPKNISYQRLYKISKQLYEEKESLEKHLSSTTNELFNLEDKIIFYDLTNTYFEGRKADSKIAQFGRSKEKRSDAKLVSLALVVNAQGFVKYSKIYEGNISEPDTLLQMIETLSKNTDTDGRKPIVGLDAGIATEENLAMLKSKQYHYLLRNPK